LISADFLKSHRENSSVNKLGQERVLYIKINKSFLIISRSVLLRMRYVSDKSCREIQNTHFVSTNFVYKIVPFMRQRGKHCRA